MSIYSVVGVHAKSIHPEKMGLWQRIASIEAATLMGAVLRFEKQNPMFEVTEVKKILKVEHPKAIDYVDGA
jgi:hypothetical protein